MRRDAVPRVLRIIMQAASAFRRPAATSSMTKSMPSKTRNHSWSEMRCPLCGRASVWSLTSAPQWQAIFTGFSHLVFRPSPPRAVDDESTAPLGPREFRVLARSHNARKLGPVWETRGSLAWPFAHELVRGKSTDRLNPCTSGWTPSPSTSRGRRPRACA